MSEVIIEGKVIKAGVRKDVKDKDVKEEVYLGIEVDENGIEKSTNTPNTEYYKPLLAKAKNDKGEVVSVSGCAQEVKKDEDYYYVEIFVPLEFSQLIEIPSVIGKKIKIKFECDDLSTPNKTPIKNKIVECEIYE